MAHTAAEMGVLRYFFSSSVCVYRDMEPDEPPLTEVTTDCTDYTDCGD